MKQPRLLIVEDETHLKETWEQMLEIFGHQAHFSKNGLEATEALEKEQFDLIVTDIQMPVKDGYFLLDYIQSKEIKSNVWVCTGQLAVDERLDAYSVDRVIFKPFNMLDLVQEIGDLFK